MTKYIRIITLNIFGGNSNILINNTISGGANGYRLQMGAENNTIIGGIVNEVEHLFTKNGNGYAVFSFEDFNDQYKFRIFGENYLKYKHFLKESEILRIRLSIREGWINKETGKPGEPRIQFLNFELLNGVIESNAKKITLKLDIKNLEEDQIKLLSKKLSKHKGKHPLYFDVYDSEKKIKLSLISENNKVSITRDLLKTLEENKLHYKLN